MIVPRACKFKRARSSFHGANVVSTFESSTKIAQRHLGRFSSVAQMMSWREFGLLHLLLIDRTDLDFHMIGTAISEYKLFLE